MVVHGQESLCRHLSAASGGARNPAELLGSEPSLSCDRLIARVPAGASVPSASLRLHIPPLSEDTPQLWQELAERPAWPQCQRGEE